MILVTEVTPSGNQKIYLNPDNIERVLPLHGGSLVNHVSGKETQIVESPQTVLTQIETHQ